MASGTVDKDHIQIEAEPRSVACLLCQESKITTPRLRLTSSSSSRSDSCDIPILKKVRSTGKEIGRGAYGRVFEVEYEKTRCAAKEVHAILLNETESEDRKVIKVNFLCECLNWSSLQHPCIVQFIG